MSPIHSIDFCPICGGGLCGVRICCLPSEAAKSVDGELPEGARGLIVCDECEALWLEPDVSTDHTYVDSENATHPTCGCPIWGEKSRWADQADIDALGWTGVINHDLDVNPQAE